jgi:hypothetical protein
MTVLLWSKYPHFSIVQLGQKDVPTPESVVRAIHTGNVDEGLSTLIVEAIRIMRRYDADTLVIWDHGKTTPLKVADVEQSLTQQLTAGCTVFFIGPDMEFLFPVAWMSKMERDEIARGYRVPLFHPDVIAKYSRFHSMYRGLVHINPDIAPYASTIMKDYRKYVQQELATLAEDRRNPRRLADAFLAWVIDNRVSGRYDFDLAGSSECLFSKNMLSNRNLSQQVGEVSLNAIAMSGGVRRWMYFHVAIDETPRPPRDITPTSASWAFTGTGTPIDLTHTRFVIAGLSYIGSPGHRNCLIYDRRTRRLVYIEPHGNVIVFEQRLHVMRKAVRRQIHEFYNALGEPDILGEMAEAINRVSKGQEDYVYLNKSPSGNVRSIQGHLSRDEGFCVTLSLMQALLLVYNATIIGTIDVYFQVNDVFLLLFVMTDNLDRIVRCFHEELLRIHQDLTTLRTIVPVEERPMATIGGRRNAVTFVPMTIGVVFLSSLLSFSPVQKTVESSTTIADMAAMARSASGDDGVLAHVPRVWTSVWNTTYGTYERALVEQRAVIIEHGDDRDTRRVVDVCHQDGAGTYAFRIVIPEADISARIASVEAFLISRFTADLRQ